MIRLPPLLGGLANAVRRPVPPVQPDPNRHHLIISGTGRAGTSYLVQLFEELGMDTGFSGRHEGMHPTCDAGKEHDLRNPAAPYLVKDPHLCEYLDEALAGGGVVVDHALIPVRDLYAAAESRRDVARRWYADPNSPAYPPPGGLWDPSTTADGQEAVLAQKLYRLLEALARHDIPTTLLHFPRVVRDPEYLYRKVAFALPGVGLDRFLAAHRAVTRPELVHDFEKRAA